MDITTTIGMVAGAIVIASEVVGEASSVGIACVRFGAMRHAEGEKYSTTGWWEARRTWEELEVGFVEEETETQQRELVTSGH